MPPPVSHVMATPGAELQGTVPLQNSSLKKSINTTVNLPGSLATTPTLSTAAAAAAAAAAASSHLRTQHKP